MRPLRTAAGASGAAARAGVAVVALLAAAMLASAPPVRAALLHATLLRTEPAAGSVAEPPVRRVRLVFSEEIDVGLSQLQLVAPDRSVVKLTPKADPTDVHALVAAVPALAPGGYRVNWRIVSADGHPVDGTFVFTIAGGAATSAAPPPDSARWGEGAGAEAAGRGTLALAAVLRGLGVGALAGFAGVLAFLAWIARAPAPQLRRVATWLGVAAVVGLAAHAVVWTRYVSPAAEVSADVMRAAAASATGEVEVARVVLAILALWAVALARRTGFAAMLALLAVAASGAVGHPSAIRPAIAVPAKSVHVLATALWLGGLLVLAVGWGGDERDAERVSSAALASVVAIALTGVLQTVLFLHRPADLVRSAYGLLVLGKAAGLVALMALGARNRYRLLPALARGSGPAALRRAVRWEAAVMAAVILLAGLLAYVPVPSTR